MGARRLFGSSRAQAPHGFEEFVHLNSARLLRVGWLLTGQTQDAEDLLQTTLAELWTKWPRISQGTNPFGYARQVMLSRFVSSRRRRWWAERATQDVPEQHILDDVADNVVAQDALAKALMTLSTQQRAVVVLRIIEDLSIDETADILGCSPATVKVQSARALSKLRRDPTLGLVDRGETHDA